MLQILGALIFIWLAIILWDYSPLIFLALAGFLAYCYYKAKKMPKPTTFENITSAELSILHTACELGDETHPLYQKCKFCPRRKNCDVSPLQKRVEKILATLAKPAPPPKIPFRRRRKRYDPSSSSSSSASNSVSNYPANYNYDYDAGDDFDDAGDCDGDCDAGDVYNFLNSISDSGDSGDSGGGDSGGGDSGGGDSGGN